MVPPYQRPYSWGEHECAQLWNDTVAAGSNTDVISHFVGAVVYMQPQGCPITCWAPATLVDGQQRLTTLILLLEALARQLDVAAPPHGFSAADLRDRYVRNRGETEPNRQFKLALAEPDDITLQAILRQQPLPPDHSQAIVHAFACLERRVHELAPDTVTLRRGLAKLKVLDVSLTPGHDNPRQVFESINTTGRRLAPADQIRSFLLTDQGADTSNRLYTEHWQPMQRALQPISNRKVCAFLCQYLALRTGAPVKLASVFEAVRTLARTLGAVTVAEELRTRAPHYAAIALGRERHPVLVRAFQDLHDLQGTATHPLLLRMYEAFAAGTIDAKDFECIIRMGESYVFRRVVCGLDSGIHLAVFANLAQEIGAKACTKGTAAKFLSLPEIARFPNDEEFTRHLRCRNFYKLRCVRYALCRLETDNRREVVPLAGYSVEHILPRTPALAPEWRADLGSNWCRVRRKWLHTLGNLTLSGYNSQYADRPFAEKRDMPGGFRESPLRLNAQLRTCAVFNEGAIQARAEHLAARAIRIWSMPA